ncbi:antitoxin [Rhodospirillum rubrum]|uniref:Uncharacterized protein n=1 Tax=Rhodospirillum rubrum (strain ATCC 11170 / ATH 1.1.1 / DSM 467 / LMG 4362 / NCIMB 8255 / S1) TaxID=269796 RepID=Q2RNG1_RHORT|nr:antitoxin Xre/MbcA/ParS toxin-binding domain-containing protein [Rhodospirillum rubrum]ABC24334.1 conserved hypothetical protein [Rhodospirillum rubrum ATCC 11170]AEO50085.1 hypothetical protein F11_18125 [Rhodospirillum rubrum F11]MBK1663048.1 antitoxin [Rhodospirillum rubrum]MBK1677988.1 antitoxin [Rhodospirillum rubrum]MBK5956052.1 antitoxin [Rhodospirillum rubrum]
MPPSLSDVGRVLGFGEGESRALSQLHLITLIEEGLSISALDRVSRSVAPEDATFKYRIVSRARLARRRKPGQDRLHGDESDRLVRLARVWTFATAVWGDEKAARDFFFRPHPLLDGRPPIDVVLASAMGAELVGDILGRLAYGTAA